VNKRTWFAVWWAVLSSLAFVLSDVGAAPAVKAAPGTCKACHADWGSVLPQGHPAVKGANLATCTGCHKPDPAGEAKKRPFSARIHLAHVAPRGPLDCKACHSIAAGRSFGLVGAKGSLGTPSKEDLAILQEVVGSWADSANTDHLHAKAGLACAPCHGSALPKADDTVGNERCLACHGPMDALAKRSEPKELKDRNPHRSHLGEVACTVCHKAHAESKVYCLDCHRKSTMTIPGAKR
jgi:hypothetical protein